MSNNNAEDFKLDVALKAWELSKYTTKELKDELASREDLTLEEDRPDLYDTCEHNMEMGYCQVKACEGSY